MNMTTQQFASQFASAVRVPFYVPRLLDNNSPAICIIEGPRNHPYRIGTVVHNDFGATRKSCKPLEFHGVVRVLDIESIMHSWDGVGE